MSEFLEILTELCPFFSFTITKGPFAELGPFPVCYSFCFKTTEPLAQGARNFIYNYI